MDDDGKMADITIEVLKDIRTEMRGMRGELVEVRDEMRGMRGELTELRGGLTELRGDVQALQGEMHALTERVDSGFNAVNHRLDGVIEIVGTHHRGLESRVKRIEDHLGLPDEH